MQNLTPAALAAWLADPQRPPPVILDVREAWELALARLPEAQHVPMGQVPGALGALDPGRPIVCLCHHGMRSLQVAHFLERQGFDDVYNLSGGIHAWATEQDPSTGTY